MKEDNRKWKAVNRKLFEKTIFYLIIGVALFVSTYCLFVALGYTGIVDTNLKIMLSLLGIVIGVGIFILFFWLKLQKKNDGIEI